MKMNFLKLRTFIPVIITGIILTSCSKDKTATPEGNLTGTWASGTATTTAMVGSKTLTQYFTDVAGLTAAQAQLLTTTFESTLQQSFTGTILVKSDKTYTSNLGGTADAGTWSLSADAKKLTIISNTDGPETFDVLQLTTTNMQLQSSESISEDLNGDAIPETINITVILSFTKK
jgi:hypothetical protein